MYAQYGNAMMGGQRVLDAGHMGLGTLGGFGIFALVGFLIFVGLVLALIIWLVARKPSASQPAVPAAPGLSSEDTALAIARERLARGEIDPDQYTAIASALSGVTAAAAP
jgi:uncharacterized membrane protein